MLEMIRNASRDEITEILQVAIARYRELFPDWEFFYTSFEKAVDKNAQLDQMIALLEHMKEEQNRSKP